jgi:hypothetical protein
MNLSNYEDLVHGNYSFHDKTLDVMGTTSLNLYKELYANNIVVYSCLELVIDRATEVHRQYNARGINTHNLSSYKRIEVTSRILGELGGTRMNLNGSLNGVKFQIRDRIIEGARRSCFGSLLKRKIRGAHDVTTIGLMRKVDFSIILSIRGMMERKYRRETIIEKCQVTLSSSKRIEVTSKVLKELE